MIPSSKVAGFQTEKEKKALLFDQYLISAKTQASEFVPREKKWDQCRSWVGGQEGDDEQEK